MTQAERDGLAKVIVTTAIYYGRTELPKAVVSMYIDDLSELSALEAIHAYQVYRRDPKKNRFPLPADILAIARPRVSGEAEAQMAATRIFQAIRNHGYCNARDAEKSIGELGWQVVRRMGGWVRVCEMQGIEYNHPAFIAHAKAIAIAEREFAIAGRRDEAPALPAPSNDGHHDLLDFVSEVKSIMPTAKEMPL